MRGDPSQPLTFDEHRDMGREIRRTHARLRELYRMAANIYGPNHRTAAAFHEVVGSLDRLTAALQAQAARDCPDASTDHLYL